MTLAGLAVTTPNISSAPVLTTFYRCFSSKRPHVSSAPVCHKLTTLLRPTCPVSPGIRSSRGVHLVHSAFCAYSCSPSKPNNPGAPSIRWPLIVSQLSRSRIRTLTGSPIQDRPISSGRRIWAITQPFPGNYSRPHIVLHGAIMLLVQLHVPAC